MHALYIKCLHPDLDSMPLPQKWLYRRSKSRIRHALGPRGAAVPINRANGCVQRM
jgi:hypothetical protein